MGSLIFAARHLTPQKKCYLDRSSFSILSRLLFLYSPSWFYISPYFRLSFLCLPSWLPPTSRGVSKRKKMHTPPPSQRSDSLPVPYIGPHESPGPTVHKFGYSVQGCACSDAPQQSAFGIFHIADERIKVISFFLHKTSRFLSRFIFMPRCNQILFIYWLWLLFF